jgi:ABC-type cobalamin/Fe3+-siderophores transport system ATPase subunit
MSVFHAERLTFAYPHTVVRALEDVSFAVERGRLLTVLGPNGSGKSTLLKLLLGALRPLSGIVSYGGRDVSAWSRAELAREIGVVTQLEDIAFPLTVRELVGMGRYPHLGPWRREGVADREAVARALERCDLLSFEQRSIATLSGGERQRARLARALAQEPRTLVLDEPTASLDIAHEMTLFELLAALVRDDGVTVVLVTHNLNLAARYADTLLLLERGRSAATGTPADVITREHVERVYRWPIAIFPHTGPGPDRGAPQVAPLAQPSTAEPSS